MAGVSRATVSRVMNGSPKVSAAVRTSVEAAIRELGYVPNRAARTLVTRRTDAVGLVISEPEQHLFSRPFFASVVRAARPEQAAADIQMVLLMIRGPYDQSRIERYLTGGHVDGALAIASHRHDRLPSIAQRLPMPIVFGGTPWGGQGGLSYVDMDNRGGARMAVTHLLRTGRRRIATITGPLDQLSSVHRLDGYRDAFPAGHPMLVQEADYSQAGGERAMTALLEREPLLDGVFAASDSMAAGAYRALRRAGRAVPDDAAVVGFGDDEELALYLEPPLTTVHQSVDGQVRRMVEFLLARLRGETDQPQAEVLPTQLVLRSSA